MKKILLTILLAALVTTCTAQPPIEISTTSDAAIFAEYWVSLLNNRDYSTAWIATTKEFKEKRTLDKWPIDENPARNFTPVPNTTRVIKAYRLTQLPLRGPGDYRQVEVTTESTSGALWHDLVTIGKINGKWLVMGHSPWKTN